MLCGIHAIKNATDVSVSLNEMNVAITELQIKDKTEKTVYGIVNVGNLHTRTMKYLITRKAHHDVEVLKFPTVIFQVPAFFQVFKQRQYNKLTFLLMCWATNGRYDLDDGCAHYVVIRGQRMYDDQKASTQVSINNLSLFGVDTRLKAYILKPRERVQQRITEPREQQSNKEEDGSRRRKRKQKQDRRKENKRCKNAEVT